MQQVVVKNTWHQNTFLCCRLAKHPSWGETVQEGCMTERTVKACVLDCVCICMCLSLFHSYFVNVCRCVRVCECKLRWIEPLNWSLGFLERHSARCVKAIFGHKRNEWMQSWSKGIHTQMYVCTHKCMGTHGCWEKRFFSWIYSPERANLTMRPVAKHMGTCSWICVSVCV